MVEEYISEVNKYKYVELPEGYGIYRTYSIKTTDNKEVRKAKPKESNKSKPTFWQKGKAHLNAVNMDVQLNEGQSFADRGFNSSEGCWLTLGYINGKCTCQPDLSEIEIYYLELGPEETLQTRGHEETHALFFLGRTSDLYEEFELIGLNPKPTGFNSEKAKKQDKLIKSFLEKKQIIENGYNNNIFGNEELLADLGGILALKKADYTDKEICKFVKEHDYISSLVLDCL